MKHQTKSVKMRMRAKMKPFMTNTLSISSHNLDGEFFKHILNGLPNNIFSQIGEVQHRRRRISSRCNSEGEEICPRSIHWAPELVLEPSRVRTSSTGSILSKAKANYDDSSYECDCGVPGCDCYNV